MDLGTLIGLVGAIGLVAFAIVVGGSPQLFYDTQSTLIVLGGTVMTTLVRFPIPQMIGTIKVVQKAFFHKLPTPEQVITEMIEVGKKARQEGVLSLETYQTEDDFLNQGLQLIVDGNEAEAVEEILSTDIQNLQRRHKGGQDIFKSVADAAPAFGMIGTLIGLVTMLANMEDVKALGPAMAVAILTTLYGAIIANVFASPLVKKLEIRSKEETLNRELTLVGVMSIIRGENPRIMETAMRAFFSHKENGQAGGQAKAA